MFHRLGLLGIVSVVLCVGIDARGNSIGVNFMAVSWGGGPYPIAPEEEAGLVPQLNWNNTDPWAPEGSDEDIWIPEWATLVDNTGVDSGAEIIWTNGYNTTGSDGGWDTPNERLYKGVINGPFFMPPEPQLRFTVIDVPYAQYDVYAYLAGFGFDADASARIGDEEYFYEQSSYFTTDGFIRATATSPENAPLATYALFEDLTSDSFTLEIIKQDGNRGGLAGLQIVQVPEPSTLGLAALALSGLLGNRWRKRRAA